MPSSTNTRTTNTRTTNTSTNTRNGGRLRLSNPPHAAYLRRLPPDTLDPLEWVAIDAFPVDNCLFQAVAVALGITRLLRKPNVSAIQSAVEQLKANVARHVCRQPARYAEALFPAAGGRYAREKRRLLPTTDPTAPTLQASVAALRAGMRTYCERVQKETCHGGPLMRLALAGALKKNVCVYRMRGDRYVLWRAYGDPAAPKINLLQAGSMAYMALVRCSTLALCGPTPRRTPVRLPDTLAANASRNSSRNTSRNNSNNVW